MRKKIVTLSKNKSYDELILSHYKKVAINNGLSSTSTMEDPYIRTSEIDFFLSSLGEIHRKEKRDLKILDVGCGNGYLLSKIRDLFPSFKLFGIEFSPELHALAYSREIKALDLRLGDARISSFFESDMDVIISERSLINILSREDQKDVLKNIFSSLRKDAFYLMSESFKEPLFELNEARSEMCLENIEESYQNLYLDEELIDYFLALGMVEEEGTFPPNYLSTQFFITRIFHKTIRPEKGKVKFSRFAKFFTEALPSAIGNYSPILFRTFRRKSL